MNYLLYTLLYTLSIYALTFILKEKDGPFNIILKLRNLLFKLNFFVQLFSCYFCLGTYSGAAIYLLTTNNFNYKLFILSSLGGGAICFLLDLFVEKLIADTHR